MFIKQISFKCIGEKWGYAIPNVKTLHGDECIPYLNLNIGDILISKVGHIDFSGYQYDIECRIEAVEVNNQYQHMFYEIKLITANGLQLGGVIGYS